MEAPSFIRSATPSDHTDDTDLHIATLPEEGSSTASSSRIISRASLHHRTQQSWNMSAKRGSLYPDGDLRNTSAADLLDVKADMMCNWLYTRQLEKQRIEDRATEGVIIRKRKDEFASCPKDLSVTNPLFFDSVQKLDVKCVITVKLSIYKDFLCRKELAFITISQDLRIQVIPSLTDLPSCQKHQFAAFVLEDAMLIVWDDDPTNVLTRAQQIEDQLVRVVWEQEIDEETTPKEMINTARTEARNVFLDQPQTEKDLEDLNEERPRHAALVQPSIVACALVMLVAVTGSGIRWIALEIKVDNNWIRLALLLVIPLQWWLGLFFFQSIASVVAQIIGPISQVNECTKYFSGRAPSRIQPSQLPHVTIQCPVYKEGLGSVIIPTIRSIEAAISTYEMQGGTANIFINDDGMQVISPEDAKQRKEFYEEHGIGWVARPKHNSKRADGEQNFRRAGKFKKASNMNYSLDVSLRLEEKLASMAEEKDTETMQNAYDLVLQEIITEDQGLTWAEGNIRIGDYILIIDSDTRIPHDCLLPAVSELELSPSVAIIQMSSGVMNVTETWFEKGITFFTNFVYTAITFAVASGDVAPFVGHNAFLRWSALQDVAYPSFDPNVNCIVSKHWSDATVSEDFDLALRLQIAGYTIRFATYANTSPTNEFKEGVSLTVYDELARWEKYAYGCSELIFHPFPQWPTKGPFTPLFRRFITSRLPFPSKVTIMAYVGTYFAIGSCWLLTLMNYFLVGWFNGHLDHYYTDSFRVYFALIVIFSALGNFALTVFRYRTQGQSFIRSLIENYKWVPLMSVFLGGISLHVSQAIVCHLCGIDMTWGATSKEATDTNFFQEVPAILRKFRFTFVFCFVVGTGMVVLGGVGLVGALVPWDWRITLFEAIWPLGMVVVSHALLPLALNPGLMQFTF